MAYFVLERKAPRPSILFILVALFALPFTFFMLHLRQDIRQHAASLTPVFLIPSSQTVAQGDKLAIALQIRPDVAPVKEIQLNLQYPSDKLSQPDISYSNSPFTVMNEQIIGQGLIRISRDSTLPVSGYTQIASLQFKAKNTMSLSEISLAPGSYALSNENKSLPLNLVVTTPSYYKDNLPPGMQLLDQFFNMLIAMRQGIIDHLSHFNQ